MLNKKLINANIMQIHISYKSDQWICVQREKKIDFEQIRCLSRIFMRVNFINALK